MDLPGDRKYTASHEWVRSESDGTLTIGITDHAQGALGDLVFLELPAAGRKVKAGEACAVVESVKAASDVYAPVDGEIVAANEALTSSPEQVNEDAWNAWLFRIKPSDPSAVAKLLDADGYRDSVGEG
jgi:glycine cleavage system H protein